MHVESRKKIYQGQIKKGAANKQKKQDP